MAAQSRVRCHQGPTISQEECVPLVSRASLFSAVLDWFTIFFFYHVPQASVCFNENFYQEQILDFAKYLFVIYQDYSRLSFLSLLP